MADDKNKLEEQFQDTNGNLVEGRRVVSPLFAEDGDRPVFLGTAFFISVNGLMLTAKHCLFKNGKLYDRFFIVHFIEDNKFVIQKIHQLRWNISDIAVILPFNISDEKTHKQ